MADEYPNIIHCEDFDDKGYDGMIEVECRYLSGPGEEVLPRSADYLRAKWAEVSI